MNFGSLTFNSAGAVSVSEDSATVLSGTSTAASLDLDSAAGITNASAASVTVSGTADFNGTSITLGDQTGDVMNFGSLTFNSTGAVSVREDSATQLTGTNTGASLVLISTGAITDATGTSLSVSGNASLSGTSITLGDQTGDVTNFGSLTFNSTGAVSVSEDSDTLLVGTSTADSLALVSTGAISNDGTANLAVGNNASFSGTSITLGRASGDGMNFGSLTFNSAGAVSVSEDSATVLSGTSTAASLDLDSAAGITNASAASVTVSGTADFNSAGAVSVSAATRVSEDSDTLLSEDSVLVGTSTADSLALVSAGAISNDGTANLAVANNASFSGTSITLGRASGDGMNFGSLTFNSAGAVSVSEDSATVLSGTSTAASLDLDSAAGITNASAASVTVSGTADFNGTSITLGDQTGDVMNFGSLTFNSTGAVSVREDSATQLTGTNTGASLVLISTGAITDATGTSLSVSGNASLSGTSITLGDQTGDVTNFGSLTFNSTGAVSVSEDSDTLLVGTSTADSLALVSAGAISNDGTANLAVGNNASFSGTSITLGRASGDGMNFGSLTFNSAGAVSVSEDSATVLSGTSTAASLDLDSAAGITNVSAASVTVSGTADFNGTSITLGDQTGDVMNFGSLTFNSTGAVSVREDSATQLTGTNTGASLVLISTGAITDATGTSLSVSGNASLSGTSITLGDQTGDVTNFGSLTFNSTGAVSVSEDSATQLTGTNTGASLVLISTGAITDATGTSLSVSGNASLSGTSITLGDQTGDVTNFGSLTFNSTGAVSVSEDSDTLLVGTSTADSLALVSAGAISNDGTANLAVGNNASFSGTSITLGRASGDGMNFGSLTFNSAGAVSVSEDSATVLSGTSTAASLDLDSAAGITNASAASVTVSGTADFNGTSITLGDQTGDVMNFGSLTFNSTGAVSVREDSATQLTGTNTGASLVLISTGAITDATGTSLSVSGNASLSGTSITLGDQTGDVTNFGSLTFNSTGAVSVSEDSDTLLVGTSTADSLALVSAGAISNDGTANLAVGNNASFSGTSITLGRASGDGMNFGSLTFNSAGAVSVSEDSATVLSGTSTAASLDLDSAAGITNVSAASVTVTGTADFNGTSITLGDQTGDVMNFGSLTFNSTGAVSVREDSATQLTGTNTGASLVLISTGAITDATGTSISVSGNASLSGTSITLGDQTGDVTNFGSLTFNSAGAVSVSEDSDTLLVGTSTADSLALVSAGAISNDGTANLAVANNASFSGTSITLGRASGDGMNFGSLTFNSAGAVSVSEDSATVLSGTSTAASLDLDRRAGAAENSRRVFADGDRAGGVERQAAEVHAVAAGTPEGDRGATEAGVVGDGQVRRPVVADRAGGDQGQAVGGARSHQQGVRVFADGDRAGGVERQAAEVGHVAGLIAEGDRGATEARVAADTEAGAGGVRNRPGGDQYQAGPGVRAGQLRRRIFADRDRAGGVERQAAEVHHVAGLIAERDRRPGEHGVVSDAHIASCGVTDLSNGREAGGLGREAPQQQNVLGRDHTRAAFGVVQRADLDVAAAVGGQGCVPVRPTGGDVGYDHCAPGGHTNGPIVGANANDHHTVDLTKGRITRSAHRGGDAADCCVDVDSSTRASRQICGRDVVCAGCVPVDDRTRCRDRHLVTQGRHVVDRYVTSGGGGQRHVPARTPSRDARRDHRPARRDVNESIVGGDVGEGDCV